MKNINKNTVMIGGRGCNGCNARRELVEISEVLQELDLGYDEEELKKKEANIEKYFKAKEENKNKMRELLDKEYLMEVQ